MRGDNKLTITRETDLLFAPIPDDGTIVFSLGDGKWVMTMMLQQGDVFDVKIADDVSMTETAELFVASVRKIIFDSRSH